MRDALLFLIVFGSIPFIYKRPAWAMMMFTWISLMNPHRLSYGAAYDFPFAALYSGLIVFALLVSKERKTMPINALTIALIVFCLWMNVTTLFAQAPDLAWKEWNRVMKTMGMIMLAMAVIRTERDIKWMTWVIGLSLGFWGLKGGIFTLKSGGSNHVFGPDGSYIGDNNALALALITAAPIVWYLKSYATKKILKLGMGLTVGLIIVSAAGSYSRGALLAGGTMLTFLWLKSRTKVRTALVMLVCIPLLYQFMPEQWFSRMETIDNYQDDGSAMGRINAWWFAFNVAKSSPLGGGFMTFTHEMFARYAPDPTDHHAAHSIYFQVLGEHGFIGLAMFLTFFFFAWRTGSRVIKQCKGKPELKWAGDLAAMCQVSLAGYAVGGAFLTLAYYDLPYFIVVLLVALERLVLKPETVGELAQPAGAPRLTKEFR